MEQLIKKLKSIAGRRLVYYGRRAGFLNRLVPFSVKARIKRWGIRELIDEDELRPRLYEAALYLSETNGGDYIGDYLEFGVCHGTSMNCAYDVINELKLDNIRFFGFDSFEGLPALDDKDDVSLWRKGQFKSDINITKYFLTNQGADWNKMHLIKGWFSETLTDKTKHKYHIEKAGIIMVDCDIYSAAKSALKFCQSLIKDKAIIFFDDWNAASLAQRNRGEKLAFDEFLDENPHLVSEEFGSYSYKGQENGKIFLISNCAA